MPEEGIPLPTVPGPSFNPCYDDRPGERNLRPKQEFLKSALVAAFLAGSTAAAVDRPVDPTFLYRRVPEVAPMASDLTTSTCRYRPLFGAGDDQTSVVKGVARYGVIKVDANGSCASVQYTKEEQIYFILEGKGVLQYGDETVPVKPDDFMYLAPGSNHALKNNSANPLRAVLMGYHVSEASGTDLSGKLQISNASLARKQVLPGHPASTKYLLLMGGKDSKRDLIAAGQVLTSLFLMEFDAGGTNHPHHHIKEEEIYLLLDGYGDMVAGGGKSGVEGRHHATPGDAYFFRLNCTVGFYADPRLGDKKARVLAVRSLYPGMKK